MRHPAIPCESGLSRGRLVLGIIGFAVLLLTFTLTPFADSSLLHFLHIDLFNAVR
jgi:hypothetical protein